MELILIVIALIIAFLIFVKKPKSKSKQENITQIPILPPITTDPSTDPSTTPTLGPCYSVKQPHHTPRKRPTEFVKQPMSKTYWNGPTCGWIPSKNAPLPEIDGCTCHDSSQYNSLTSGCSQTNTITWE